MVKLFGFRISPFFLFILGLECLALLVSIYIGTLLYQGKTVSVSFEMMDRSFYSGVFLILLLSILTPGFFYQARVINNVKKSISGRINGLIGALITMFILLSTSNLTHDPKSLYLAALLSACAGIIISQTGFLKRYWRFLVRAGVN